MEMEVDDAQSSTMNRALVIPEILGLIIRHLHPLADTWSDSDILLDDSFFNKSNKFMKDLRSAALVCTHFSEPALDYLWWIMTDLTPLFRLLPAFKPASDAIKVSLLDGSISPKDLHRFDTYARRIRAYHGTGREKFHPSTILRILKECSRSYLLPTLQSVVIDGHVVMPICLVSPSLRGFKAHCYLDRQQLEMYTCIPDLPRTANNLIHLNLWTNLTTDTVACITQLRHLHYLQLNHLPGNGRPDVEIDMLILLKIASAPVLRELRLLQNIVFKPLPSPLTMSETVTFPALERLETTAGSRTMHALNDFLRSTSLPHLKAFLVHLGYAGDFNFAGLTQWRELLEVLVGITTTDFQHFRVSQEEDGAEDVQQSTLSVRDVLGDHPLQLVRFEIAAPLFASISTVDLRHIARMWPSMKALDLSSDPSPLLGLHALSLIAQSLPSLEELRMALPSETMTLVQLPVLDHGLRILHLVSLKHPSPRDFVRSLDKIFPRLQDWYLYAYDEEIQDLWDDASDLINMFHAVRGDQRLRQVEQPVPE